MRINTISYTNFGLRKFNSFQDIARQRHVKPTVLESSDLKIYKEYMKNILINMKYNAARALESAKKVFIK